jgi:hypothetical protein
MRAPLTQAVLKDAQCDTPGCDHSDHSRLWLHAQCHPRAGLAVVYDRATGVVTVECRKCTKLVAELAVAP